MQLSLVLVRILFLLGRSTRSRGGGIDGWSKMFDGCSSFATPRWLQGHSLLGDDSGLRVLSLGGRDLLPDRLWKLWGEGREGSGCSSIVGVPQDLAPCAVEFPTVVACSGNDETTGVVPLGERSDTTSVCILNLGSRVCNACKLEARATWCDRGTMHLSVLGHYRGHQ